MVSPMDNIVYSHRPTRPTPTFYTTPPRSLTHQRGLKRAAPDSDDDDSQRPDPDPQPTQQPAQTRVITGMLATIPQALWSFGSSLIFGLVDLVSSRHAPPAQQQAAQQHAASSQPTHVTSVATDRSDRKRRAVDTSPVNASLSSTSPTHTSPTAHARRPMQPIRSRRVPGPPAAPQPVYWTQTPEHKARRAALYAQYCDPTLNILIKKAQLAKARREAAGTIATTDNVIWDKDRQVGVIILKAKAAKYVKTVQRAVQLKNAGEAKAAADREAADIAAAEEAARLEVESQQALIAAEEEKALIAAQEEKALIAAEEKRALIAAQEERELIAVQEEKALVAAQEERARITAEQRRRWDETEEEWEERAIIAAEEDRLIMDAMADAEEAEKLEAIAAAKQEKQKAHNVAEKEEARRLEETKDTRSQTIVELSPELSYTVEGCMNSYHPDRQTIVQLGSIPLQKISIKRIMALDSRGTDSWLDDDAVNAFFNSITDAKNRQTGYVKSNTSVPAFANLQTAWYEKYSKEKAKGLKRWMKRAGIGAANMLKCERIFLPINTGNHWTLLIINGVDRSIEYLDSLGGDGKRFFSIARDLLKSELGSDYREKEWVDLKRNRSSIQDNMNDCGVFTCMNGLAAAKGRPYKDVTAKMMSNARIMMVGSFLNKGLEGELEL